MIPTRMHQSFKCGVVLGFNKLTGAVVCAHPCTVDVDGFDNEEIDSKIKETMQSYPSGYTWPLISDLDAIVDELTIKYKGRELTYFVSRSLVESYSYITGEFEQQMIQMRFSSNSNNCYYYLRQFPDCFYSHRNFDSHENEGCLIPVLLINGENCDTY